MKKDDVIEVKIEKLSFGGNAISRHESMVVFVEDAAPGDHLLVKIKKLKKNYAEASIVEILSPGPERREAPCPVANKCGGCQWQHITYNEQLNQKNLILKEQFQKAKLLSANQLKDIIPSTEFHYRNRIQIRSKHSKLGFYQKSSNEIVNIQTCLITKESINLALKELRTQIKSSKNETKHELFLNLKEEVQIRTNQAHGAEDGFSQVNEEQNKKMIVWLTEQLVKMNVSTVYDLYAGNGNFSRSVDLPLIHWIAVELNSNAVREGKKINTQNSIEWHSEDVSHFLTKQKIAASSVLLLDPPRIGCSEQVIESLAKSGVDEILYISCNPSTFIRDVERLRSFANYEILEIQPIDMFPQTYHIELMAHLRLKV